MTWFWLALGAAALWGFSYTINQVTLKHFSAIELLLFESFVVFSIAAIYFVWRGDFHVFMHKLANPKQLALIILSSFVYIVASLLILKSISASNAALAAIIESCYPIFTVIFAFILFGEIQLNLISALGYLLILCGIIIVKTYGH